MVIDGEDTYVVSIIMAAGKGTRMKSNKHKLVHKIYGKELVKRVVELAKNVGSDDTIAVIGYMKEQIQAVLGDSVKYVEQDKDAATSYGGKDFKFVNDKDYKIKINSYVYENKIVVALYKV